ncbi:NAD(P)-binding protein [Nocardioides zeae]|uniref:NAD(P)-binding protein n=1 Tax=Nocardioides zeae TaxID=1457234 RepID=UPI0019D629F0
MNPVLVVGAGIAGVACGRALTDAGVPVRLVDRGHRVGGRMASRRIAERPVDLGASYFTVPDDDPAFAEVVERWRTAGLARAWTDTFHAVADGALTPKPGPVRWGAPGGLRSLVEDLAAPLDVRRGAVTSVDAGPEGPVVDGEPVRAVVLAMPDPQAHRLLADPLADPPPGWTGTSNRCWRSWRRSRSAPGASTASSPTVRGCRSSPTTGGDAATTPPCSSRTRPRSWRGSTSTIPTRPARR